MAILTGINTRLRGSAGDWTFARTGGQTVAKQKIAPKETPTRTKAQMIRRVQWANIINVWRAFDGKDKPSFENKAAKVSDFNEFMSANIGTIPIYLTKDQARMGGAVIAAYQITRGSLPSVDVADIAGGGGPGRTGTDISLGDLTIGDETTIKQFSDAVVANNVDYAYGDQISFFRATQTVDAQTGVPRIKIIAYEVTLDGVDNTTKLYEVVTDEGFSTFSGKLATSQLSWTGGMVWVHSRRGKGRTQVSTQRFLIKGTVPDNFNTVAARDAAILSYGGTLTDEFLTPNDENIANVNP